MAPHLTLLRTAFATALLLMENRHRRRQAPVRGSAFPPVLRESRTRRFRPCAAGWYGMDKMLPIDYRDSAAR